MAFGIVKHRALSHEHYCSSLPGLFALLLGIKPGDQAMGLAILQDIWEASCACEKARRGSADALALWNAVPPLRWVIVREILILLAEVSFKAAPPKVMSMCRSVFESFGTSLPCETFFNRVRQDQKVNSGPLVTPAARWNSAIVRDAFGQFGRPEIHVHSSDRASAPSTPPKEIFMVSGSDPSLPKAELDKLIGTQTWQSYSLQSKHLIPAALALLRSLAPKGTWEKAGMGWHALLLEPGDSQPRARSGGAASCGGA